MSQFVQCAVHYILCAKKFFCLKILPHLQLNNTFKIYLNFVLNIVSRFNARVADMRSTDIPIPWYHIKLYMSTPLTAGTDYIFLHF